MFLYDLLHLIVSVILSLVASFGGIYALRTLKMLYENPEVLKSQRDIWVPILVSGGFLTASGISHLMEHFTSYGPELNLLSEYFMLVAYPFLTFSTYQYYRLQKKYDEIKHKALQKMNS